MFKDIAGWLGFGQVEAIEAGLPLFLFAILFGLSMDYHVFLLSRIRERFDQTGRQHRVGRLRAAHHRRADHRGGGHHGGGVRRLRRRPLVALQQMGFGLAVAVALDATIVRSILVPATMKLLGDRNWYLPSWLEWLPEIHIEGVAAPEVVTERKDELVSVG